jgi:hypothetical protein
MAEAETQLASRKCSRLLSVPLGAYRLLLINIERVGIFLGDVSKSSPERMALPAQRFFSGTIKLTGVCESGVKLARQVRQESVTGSFIVGIRY